MIGMEVEVRAKPHPIVVVTTCDGHCYGGETWPAAISDDGRQISFTVKDEDMPPVSYVGRFEGNALVIDEAHEHEKPPYRIDERMVRVAKPKPGQTAQLGHAYRDAVLKDAEDHAPAEPTS